MKSITDTASEGRKSGENRFRIKGEFVWHQDMSEPLVRDRSDIDPASKKFEFVSPEEIQLAILQQVKNGFSMSSEDAITCAARALGFQRVTTQAKSSFELAINKMVQDEMLIDNNGYFTSKLS